MLTLVAFDNEASLLVRANCYDVGFDRLQVDPSEVKSHKANLHHL